MERFYPFFVDRGLRIKLRRFHQNIDTVRKALHEECGVKVIHPSEILPVKSVLDTDKDRINASVDIGILDAEDFLRVF